MRFPNFIALVSSLALAACGGAGNNVGGVIEDPVVLPPAEAIGLLDAEYYSVGAALRGNSFGAMSGSARATSASDLVVDGLSNDMGNVVVGPVEAQFQVKEDYSVGVAGLPRPAGLGGFGADGAYGIYAGIDPSRGPQMHIMARRGELNSGNQLIGRWHTAWIAHGATGGVGIAASAVIGTNDVEISDATLNAGGSIVNPNAVLVDYTVSNQRFVFDPATTGILGGMSEDTNVMILGGGSRPATGPVLHVWVRRSINATTDVLVGEHWVTWMAYESTGWVSYSGTATLNANKTGRIVARYTDGVIIGNKTLDFRFDVSPSGKLVIGVTGPDLMSLEGGVTEDGRFAVAGGSTTTDAGAVLLALVRK